MIISDVVWDVDDAGILTINFYPEQVVDDPHPIQDPITLTVPYHSQWEADANKWSKDCGPATVEMVGEYYTGPTATSTNDIMEFITGGSNSLTSADSLAEAAKHFYDVTLTKQYNHLFQSFFNLKQSEKSSSDESLSEPSC